jgi:DNA-binding NarL/FixJ family response regulator
MKTQKLRVLIVDDHLLWRKTLNLFFSTLPNIKVIGMAADGESAVAVCKKLPPDLVVLDVNMPGMDGFKTARKLLKDNPGLWIIGVTADETAAMKQRAKKAGMRNFVRKDLLLDYLPPIQPTPFAQAR